MSDKIKVTIGVVPIETITLSPEQGSQTQDQIATEVGKSLGGVQEAAVTNYTGSAAAQGYKDAAVNYLEAPDGSDTTDISSEATASFVFIKNTGKTFSSATVLGATLSKALKIMVGTTLIAVLDPGECLVLKDDNAGIVCTGIHVRTVDLDGSNNASAGHLAVEYLVVD